MASWGVATLVGVVLFAVAQPRAVDTPGSKPEVSASPSAPMVQQVTAGAAVVDLAAPVWDLAYDEKRSRLWFVVAQVAGEDTLYGVDVSSGRAAAYKLPETDYNGVTTQIKVGGDGTIWLTQPYRLVSFDPDREVLTSVAVELEDGDRIADPIEPGTWISAIAPVGDGVLVARNNIARLDRYSAGLALDRGFAIDESLAGAWDLLVTDQQLLLLTGSGADDRLVVLDEAFVPVVGVDAPAERVQSQADRIILSGPPSNGAGYDPRDPTRLSTAGVGGALAAIDPRGGIVVYRPEAGVIERWVDGSTVSRLALPDVTVHPRGGDQGPFLQAAQVSALVVDSSGTTWYAQLDDGGLYSVRLP